VRALLLLMVGGTLACHDQRPRPRDLELTPRLGRDDRATPIEISGRFIAVVPEIEQREVTGVRGLRVWLGEEELHPWVLGPNRLGALVPYGMRQGPLDLEVVDPYEQTETIPDAFCVLGAAAQVASLDVSAPASATAGEPFTISLTAHDAEGVAVDRFNGYAVLSGALVAVVGPFVGGTWTGTVAATAFGSVSLDAEIDLSKDPARTCVDAGRGSAPIEVAAPPLTAALAFVTAPQTLDAGACSGVVEVERLDAAGAPFAPSFVETVTFQALSGVEFYSDAACTIPVVQVDFAAGDSRVQFNFIATAVGATPIGVSVGSGIRAQQIETIVGGPPGAPGMLAYQTPPRTILEGTCSPGVIIGVTNAAGDPVAVANDTPVLLDTGGATGFRIHADPACSTAAIAVVTIPAGSSQATFYFTGLAGEVDLTATSGSLGSAVQTATIFRLGCGDGVIDAGEVCDDGNRIDFDGCSATCGVEVSSVCAREPSICVPVGSTYVVDDDTCPAVGSGTEADPFCAINSALGRTNIVVRDGVYDETVVFTTNHRVIAENASLDSSAPASATIETRNNAVVEIVGLTISSRSDTAVEATGTSTLILREVEIGPAALNGVHLLGGASLQMHRSWISSANDGMYLDTTGSYEIRNSVIVENIEDGLEIGSSTPTSAIVVNITVAYNGDSGLDCDQGPLTVHSSIIWGNVAADADGCTALYSNVSTGTLDPTSISLDPLFTSDGTYHVQPGSPCIDNGSSWQSSQQDFDGDDRPMGTGYDMGADEAG
jgi:cysteine-rich repeat protein